MGDENKALTELEVLRLVAKRADHLVALIGAGVRVTPHADAVRGVLDALYELDNVRKRAASAVLLDREEK